MCRCGSNQRNPGRDFGPTTSKLRTIARVAAWLPPLCIFRLLKHYSVQFHLPSKKMCCTTSAHLSWRVLRPPRLPRAAPSTATTTALMRLKGKQSILRSTPLQSCDPIANLLPPFLVGAALVDNSLLPICIPVETPHSPSISSIAASQEHSDLHAAAEVSRRGSVPPLPYTAGSFGFNSSVKFPKVSCECFRPENPISAPLH